MPLIGSGLLSAGSAPAFVGAYDGISNLAAVYSVRRVLTSYTGPLLRLRRDSDNAESDFGYVAATGDLDTAAIATWLGGATGYVATWYDQGASGLDATQATAGYQFVYGASVVGSKPGLMYDTSYRGLGLNVPTPQFVAGALNAGSGGTGYVFSNRGGRLLMARGVVVSANTDRFGYQTGTKRVNGAAADLPASGDFVFSINRGGDEAVDTGDTLGLISGARVNQSGYIGHYAEFIILGAAPSTADHNTIGGSMASYYGLTWNTIA